MAQEFTPFLSNSLKKTLSKSARAYFVFLERLPIPVIVFDNEFTIRFFNQKLLELSAFSASELIDAPVYKLFQEVTDTGIQKLLKYKKNKVFRQKITGKRGRLIDCQITLRNTDLIDSIVLKEIYFQSVTDNANESLTAALHQKLKDIQTYANLGYWELKRDRSSFKACDECLRLLGINSLSGFVKFTDLLSSLPRKEDRDAIEKGLIVIAGTDSVFQTDIKTKTSPNGESLLVRFSAHWSDDAPEGLYKGIIQDITHTKKIEKELMKAKEKAESADRLKSHFLTNLSYEIRTPMNAIIGFAELLNLEGLSKEQKQEYTKVIRLKGNSLLSLIDDGIELSKFETGSVTINKTEFVLFPMLKELYDEFDSKRILLGKNNISLELKISDGHLHENIYTDQGRLQQLLSNLLSNAIKFTEKGVIEFGYKESGKFFKFFVKDTGIGIEEEDQDTIFNRFHDIEETTTRKYGGSGLNLTISRHIVHLLGGKIKVKSEINRGSRFQISIPIESSKRKKTDMTEFDVLKTINWKERIILIAEDEDMNYKFLEAILQKTQTQILRAQTGTEAVELCKNISKIDLVLMDIKMPVMNGFDATREIKKIRPSLPIIAQTAFANQDELLKCQQSGCDDIITKPIDINLLFKKITDLLH